MSRAQYMACWAWAFAFVLLWAAFAIAIVARSEQRHPHLFIYVGADCKAGPLVLSEDDTDPALEGCRRVDTHEIDRP